MKINFLVLVAAFAAGSLQAQTSQPPVLSQYKPSDQVIISDLAVRSGGGKPSCPGEGCQFIMNSWARLLDRNAEDKRLLDSLASKPPHIQSQTLVSEFNNRYQRLASTFNNEICLDAVNWSIYNDQNSYYIGTNGGHVVYLETNLDGNVRLIVPEAGGKILRGIQNQYVTEAVYSRLQALIKYPSDDKRSFVRACGKIVGEYVPPTRPGAIPDPELAKYRFALSKPMEIVRPGDTSRLTLPNEWFRN